MSTQLRSRFAFICLVALASVILLSIFGINLGLDLRGGEHLILHIVTDDAVRGETDRAIQSLGPEIRTIRTANNQFKVSGTDAYGLSRNLPNWDATTNSELRLKPSTEANIRNAAVDQTIRVIENRLDRLGVGEVSVQRYGDPKNYEVLVELPGVENPDRVRQILKSTALLEFKLVDNGPFNNVELANQSLGGFVPGTLEVLSDVSGHYYVVQKVAPVSGSDLKDAFSSRDGNGSPAVGFALKADGARRFGDLTRDNIGRFLAVVLDNRIQSVARIDTPITDSGIIQGSGAGFAPREAEDLVLVLKSGALPASLEYAEEDIVGPSLGADSIHHGVMASIVALIAVVTFMLFYYRWAGVNAVIAMLLNLMILLGSMSYFRGTLTLPGIAGIILTIGVGIDSNVLVFERIREEIRGGYSPASAVSTAFRKVFITLVDTHLAALISAAFLFIFGTGTIKGFAVTLVIGLVSNLFTSIFVSRTLFDWILSRQNRGEKLSI